MVFQPGSISCRQFKPAYGRRMTGDGDSHQLSQRHGVIWKKWGADLEAVSLDSHMEMQHGRTGHAVATTAPELLPDPLSETQVDFPRMAPQIDCPVKGCPGRATNWPKIDMYFMHWHMEDTIFILNEGTISHPQCGQYNILILREPLEAGQFSTKICKRGAEQNNRRLADASTWKATRTEFRGHYYVLERVERFKYLFRILSYENSEWKDMTGNLWKVWRK